MWDKMQSNLGLLPAPFKVLVCILVALLAGGALRVALHLILGPAAHTPYRHMRHKHRANDSWRPARFDLARQLLFFATARRVTTDFLAPLLHLLATILVALSLVPGEWRARLLLARRALREDPLAGVLLLGGTLLLQDTLRNAVSGLELTTTHIRFDKNDRVQFHASGIPEGIVRHVTAREVVLKCAGGHVFIPAALAVSLAVTVRDDEAGEGEGALNGDGGVVTPGAPPALALARKKSL